VAGSLLGNEEAGVGGAEEGVANARRVEFEEGRAEPGAAVPDDEVGRGWPGGVELGEEGGDGGGVGSVAREGEGVCFGGERCEFFGVACGEGDLHAGSGAEAGEGGAEAGAGADDEGGLWGGHGLGSRNAGW